MLLSVSVIDFPFRGLALWLTCVWHWFSWFFWGMIDFLSELAIPTVKWMPTGIIDYRKPECLDRLKFQDAIIHVLFCFFVFFFCVLFYTLAKFAHQSCTNHGNHFGIAPPLLCLCVSFWDRVVAVNSFTYSKWSCPFNLKSSSFSHLLGARKLVIFTFGITYSTGGTLVFVISVENVVLDLIMFWVFVVFYLFIFSHVQSM